MDQQNQITNSNPSLMNLLNLFKKDLLLNFNCHHIGEVQSFDATKQTAQVTISYKQTYFPSNEKTNAPRLVDYPVLADCPVICLSGGTGALTFPIAKGDPCVVLFNDRDIDNWFSGSTTSSPETGRLHSFSDGLVLVGVRNLAGLITEYDTDSVSLRKGTTKVRVYDDKVLITFADSPNTFEFNNAGKLKITNATDEFVSALSKLFDDIKQAYTVTMLGNQPLVMPTYVADLAKFDSFKG